MKDEKKKHKRKQKREEFFHLHQKTSKLIFLALSYAFFFPSITKKLVFSSWTKIPLKCDCVVDMTIFYQL